MSKTYRASTGHPCIQRRRVNLSCTYATLLQLLSWQIMSHNQLPFRRHRSPRKRFVFSQVSQRNPLRSKPVSLHPLPTALNKILDSMALKSRRCQVCASAWWDSSQSGNGDGEAAGVESYGGGRISAGSDSGRSDEIERVLFI